MEVEELQVEEELEITRKNLLNIKKMYKISIFSYLNYGNQITSKSVKDSGLHLISLSNEMFKFERKINSLSENKYKKVEEINYE